MKPQRGGKQSNSVTSSRYWASYGGKLLGEERSTCSLLVCSTSRASNWRTLPCGEVPTNSTSGTCLFFGCWPVWPESPRNYSTSGKWKMLERQESCLQRSNTPLSYVFFFLLQSETRLDLPARKLPAKYELWTPNDTVTPLMMPIKQPALQSYSRRLTHVCCALVTSFSHPI